MDSATPFRILAVCCAIGVYALCARNLFRYSSSSSGDPVLLKAVLLSAGHFAALVIGYVILSDTVGASSAGLYTVAIAVSAFALDSLFTSRWEAQEKAQRKQVEELKAMVASLSNKIGTPPPATSLEEACSKAAKAFDLTRREQEVLGLLLAGLSYAEIEERLFLSHSTVKTHVRNLYRKMEVNRRESLPQKVSEYSTL